MINVNKNTAKESVGTSREANLDKSPFLFEELPMLPEAKGKDECYTSAENTFRRKRDLKQMLLRSVCRLLAFTGVVSYAALGYYGVLHIKNKGVWNIVADGIFGGVRTRVEAVQMDEGTTPESEHKEDSAIVENTVIKSEDLSCGSYDEVFNETAYDPDEIVIQSSSVPEFKQGDAVLIIHTHGTESYYFANSNGQSENFRSKDPRETVVAVGSAFAEILEANGIKTYHCTEMFDSESYIDAYVRSSKAVSEYLKQHPDISYVIDIHRDAVIRSDGTVVKTLADGVAQLMIVCGTDEMGADFPKWKENFSFGKEYQRKLFESHHGIVRHMNLRSASFNQQLCERYLLLEVGTCGNTLDEAIAAAKLGAETFAKLIKR